MATNPEKYKKIFLAEAEEKILALNMALLSLEKEPGNNKFGNNAMRAAHTLKSSAAAMNFMEMSRLNHAMEDIFEEVCTKKRSLSRVEIETLFAAVDLLSLAVSNIKKGANEPDTKSFIEMLQKLKENPKEIKEKNLKSVEAIISANKPKNNTLQPKKLQAATYTGALAPIEAIKVDVATLDKLMNLTEELLVEKMKLSEVVRQAKEKPEDKLALATFESISESLNRFIPELQLHVTQARMIPIGQIFERFPRMIRDIANVQGKEVDLQMEGQEIELDRTVIDRLGEPLIHLLRNAVDHGIEKKGQIRLAAIRERDNVRIEVSDNGTGVNWQKVIETALTHGIIDKEKRNKLIASIQTGSEKLQPELINLLYQISTNDTITETSGRGVGLGIVKSVIESLGGKVSLESSLALKGKEGLPAESSANGTKFTLHLPLTLAIIPALLFRVGKDTFALPLSQIDRSVILPWGNIKRAFDQEVAVIENVDIPIVRLDKLFGMERKQVGIFLDEEDQNNKKNLQASELMVITKHEHMPSIGLVIDELMSKQDIVVKPLKGRLRQVKGFAGVTLLGDGRPALILDVTTLIIP